MCQPRWWGEREQMHALLRPAGDQMYDTRAWRGPAVVGGDGIDRRYPLSQRNTPQAVEDFCFCALAPLRHADGPRLCLLLCFVQVFGCRHDEAIHALRRPASEKRQGTKSREVGHRRCCGAMEI